MVTVLRISNNNIFDAIKTHTGKEVEFLGDAKDKSKKRQKENDKQK
jgi:hypothetical protein